MERRGPRNGLFKRAFSNISYNIDWKFDWVHNNNNCKLKNAQGHISFTFIFPKLANPVSNELKRRWDKYLAGSKAYREHYRITARKMVAAVDNSIKGFNAQDRAGCTRATRQLAKKIEEIYDVYEKTQVLHTEREHRPGGRLERLQAQLRGNE